MSSVVSQEAALFNAISMAYGISSHASKDLQDTYGYVKRGVQESSFWSTLKGIAGTFGGDRDVIQESYVRDDFRSWEPINISYFSKFAPPPTSANHIPFPVKPKMTDSEQWIYSLDPDYIDYINSHYVVHALTGQVGSKAKSIFAIMGFIALPLATAPKDTPVYIAFKGTQGGLGLASVAAGLLGRANPEWNSNCSFSTVPFPGLTGKVHGGFYRIYAPLMHENILDFLEGKNRDKVSPYAEKLYERKIYVCGHSLGGALASICALSLAKAGYPRVKLFTLATPAIGDKELMTNFERCLPVGTARHSFHLKGDPVCAPPVFSGMVPFPSVDLSDSLNMKIKTKTDNHYFETIRRAFKQRKKGFEEYPLLITCRTTEKDLEGRTLVSHNPLTVVTGHRLPEMGALDEMRADERIRAQNQFLPPKGRSIG